MYVVSATALERFLNKNRYGPESQLAEDERTRVRSLVLQKGAILS